MLTPHPSAERIAGGPERGGSGMQLLLYFVAFCQLELAWCKSSLLHIECGKLAATSYNEADSLLLKERRARG